MKHLIFYGIEILKQIDANSQKNTNIFIIILLYVYNLHNLKGGFYVLCWGKYKVVHTLCRQIKNQDKIKNVRDHFPN